MKKHLGNFTLLIIFFGLLAVPLVGFKMVNYAPSNGNVLSETDTRNKSEVVSKKEEKERKEKEPVYLHPSNVIRLLR